MLSLIPQPYRAIAIAAVLAALVGIGWGAAWHVRGLEADRAMAKVEQAIAEQKIAAANLLTTETQKTADAERALADFKGKQETTDALNSQAIDDLSGKLSSSLRSATARSRLCGGGPASPNPAAASASRGDASIPDGGIPAATSDFLGRLTLDADRINNAYQSCRAERINLTTP